MAVHHPHFLDFSSPPNTVAMVEAPQPSSLDHGQLLALHVVDGTDMTTVGGGGVPHTHRVLVDDTAAWPPQTTAVSLSLYNNYSTGASSLFGHHHQQQQQLAAVHPAAAVQTSLAPNHQLSAHHHQPSFQLRSSRYLGPVQELLSEFCSLLEGDMNGGGSSSKRAPKAAAGGKWDDVKPSSSSSGGLWGHPSLSSMDLLELERRKTRLLSMVEEVDRRYRRYREQIRAVEVSFEAVAGAGAAQVYTRLALRAMSRHFRCLRDALVAQVRALRKAMGERDGGGAASAPAGATKGDTPRLKVLDQCLRQQRAFQQLGTIESYPWRPQRGLPESAVAVLRAWLFEHFLHPYPNDVDKHILARQTGLSRSQVSNWFINARVRLWKPMIEDMYMEEEKQQSEAATQNPSGGAAGAVKPEQHNTATMAITSAAIGGGAAAESHFVRAAANSSMVSPSIVTHDGAADHDLFMSSSCYPKMLHGNHHQGHGGAGAAAVSLTLGLQHQQPFIAASSSTMTMHQRSLMLSQGDDDDHDPVLPYRDLMGSYHHHLLHDLA
ncbi:hypothetical protein BS78_10G005400 [Paspalum vaginatum]|nr:hypothetical protein BS78_10G005400 [Paspalum vaginatum]